MVQRLGRAGRKRAGRIVVLVADEKVCRAKKLLKSTYMTLFWQEKDTLSSGTKMSASVHKLLREVCFGSVCPSLDYIDLGKGWN